MSKVISTSMIIFIFLISGFSVAKGVTEESLVGYWPFDEGIGKKVKDASGHGNDGDLVDDPKWVNGKFGSALDFDGKSYVVVPDNDSLDLTDALTIMAWFNLTSEPTVGNLNRMMSKNNSYFVLFDFSDPNSIDFLVKPGNDFVESTTVNWEIGQWYHFAGTYDGDTLRIYINGELEGETDGVPSIDTSDLELWIGADDWHPNYFPGIIDEVRIYSKALTDVEINQTMKEPAAVQPEGKLSVTWGMIKVYYH